ncbi:uncharacterized protein LOC126378004 [Pectinophora gossypiella]|uniref:uncharacterized protein LOC126378004 n=1 Tax=Pectinophora gossypiella TaxID=13191 RepID=UPI00214EDA28|nr:uncharacterized protein LOC126378004 [Pectinophora gossypiella]
MLLHYDLLKVPEVIDGESGSVMTAAATSGLLRRVRGIGITTCHVAYIFEFQLPLSARYKRDNAVGALDIVTNNAHPIHAEVKSESLVPIGDISTADKVTPPKDSIYPSKSLRKSWPLTSRLDLVRSVTRVVTLVVLVISAAFEFYPLLQHLYDLYYF